MNLGQTLGLVHGKACKETYRAWSKNPSQETKAAMIAAKKDCALCELKNRVRQEAKKQINQKVVA